MKNVLRKIAKLDYKLLMIIDRYDNKYMSRAFSKFTYLAEGGVYAILIFIALFLFPPTRYRSYLLGFGTALNAILVNLIIKKVVKRPRPFNLYKINISIPKPKDFSFPSGHTSVTAAATVVLIYYGVIYNIGIWYFLVNILFLILMGFSRIYLKVHFLSDVIAGAIIGSVNGIIALLFRDFVSNLGNYIFVLLFGS